MGPGVMVFGDGADGGREATFEGRTEYTGASAPWDGYVVVQAKFLQRPRGTEQDGPWAIKELEGELRKFEEEQGSREQPDYFVFVTNAVLSPGVKGGKDRAVSALEEAKSWGLKDYAIWDYDQLRTYLDLDNEVRTTWGWITAGDVLGAVLEQLENAAPEFESTIANYLEKTLISDRFVRLEEAGYSSDDPTPLSQVFVDLPLVGDEDEPALFLRTLLEHTARKFEDAKQGRGRFVLLGGPGQGKTTVGQFACQVFRAALLSAGTRKPASVEGQEAVQRVQEACASADLPFERAPRFPVRVVLTDLANALAVKEQSLVAWIADQISHRVGNDVAPEVLKEWLGAYPWFLVLDGLDEVPANAGRNRLLKCLDDFWVDAGQAEADVVVLATTRPQGYNDDFAPDRYRHLRLAELSAQRALEYGQRLAEARYSLDSDRTRAVSERLARAVEDPTTVHLMRSPLQVAIMTSLVDRYGQPPNERWSLFHAYYDVIYQREQERDTDAAPILRQFRPDIDAIHARVGLALQVLTTHEGHSDPRLTAAQLTRIVDQRLADEGHLGSQTTRMVEQIRQAAELRLVFLVGAEADRIGFEIRSLQEFMAAGALVDTRDQLVLDRLRTIAALPSWRNVFLFAAGDCFVNRQYLREPLMGLCRALDVDGSDALMRSTRGGARLALDLLEDRVAQRQPGVRRVLAAHALEVLQVPSQELPIRLALCFDGEIEDLFRVHLDNVLRTSDAVEGTNACRCLAVLNSQGQTWAADLLAAHPPVSGSHAMRFLELLPRYAVAALPEEYLTSIVRSLNIRDLVRLSREELAPLLDERGWRFNRRERTLRVSLPDNGSRLTLHALPRGGRADASDMTEDSEEGSPALNFLKAASEFENNPSRESLHRALRRIARQSNPETWTDAAGQVSWPLGRLIVDAESSEQIEYLADQVLAGNYGDETEWLVAERAWETDGLRLQDGSEDTGVLFPMRVAGMTVAHDANQDIERLIEEFGALHSTRPDECASFARMILWRLGMANRIGETTRVPMESLVMLIEAAGTIKYFLDVVILQAGDFDSRASSQRWGIMCTSSRAGRRPSAGMSLSAS